MSQDNDQAYLAVLRHRTVLFSIILNVVHNPTWTEDVLSDATLEIARSWDDYDPARKFLPWAAVIARRTAYAHLREREHVQLWPPEDIFAVLDESLAELDDQSALDERKEALHCCLDRMAGFQRRLILLKFYHGCSPSEVARHARKSVPALYPLIGRLLKILRKCVREQLASS